MAKPPEGEDWIDEIKLDGYRAQVVIDEPSVRIFTRRGLDWTSKYRDLAEAAKTLDVESAIIDGEIIVLNDAGLSDFGALRKAITRRQHDLYFVAFDLLHINGHDLRDMALEDRREILASIIPPDIRIQFSQALPGEAKGKPAFALMAEPGTRKYIGSAFVKRESRCASFGKGRELAGSPPKEMPKRPATQSSPKTTVTTCPHDPPPGRLLASGARASSVPMVLHAASTPEAPRVDKGVVRFRGVLKKFGLVFSAEEILRASHVRKLKRCQHIGGGGEIVEAAELILQALHRRDEPSMAFGFRLALVKRLEELRRIAQLLCGDAHFMAGLVIGIDEILPPFATFFQDLSNTSEAKSLDDCSYNVSSDWSVRQSPMEIHSAASIIKERARTEESDASTAA